MTTATAPRPTTAAVQGGSNSHHARLLATYPSTSQPGHLHEVWSRIDGSTYCTCRGFGTHGHCWHTREQAKLHAPLALCPVCRVNPVIDLPTCVMCAAVAVADDSYRQGPPRLMRDALPMFYDSKACAGYLREHPATAERVATFWCDACTPDDCR